MAPTQTKRLLQASGDPLYELCNPPPVQLASRSEAGSSAAHTDIDHYNESLRLTPSIIKIEESPGFQARAAHKNGNIIITADYQGHINVFRQDCAYKQRSRNNENWESGALFGKKILGRSPSTNTHGSRQSNLASASNPNFVANGNGHPSDRILSWRQSVDHSSIHSVPTTASRETFATAVSQHRNGSIGGGTGSIFRSPSLRSNSPLKKHTSLKKHEPSQLQKYSSAPSNNPQPTIHTNASAPTITSAQDAAAPSSSSTGSLTYSQIQPLNGSTSNASLPPKTGPIVTATATSNSSSSPNESVHPHNQFQTQSQSQPPTFFIQPEDCVAFGLMDTSPFREQANIIHRSHSIDIDGLPLTPVESTRSIGLGSEDTSRQASTTSGMTSFGLLKPNGSSSNALANGASLRRSGSRSSAGTSARSASADRSSLAAPVESRRGGSPRGRSVGGTLNGHERAAAREPNGPGAGSRDQSATGRGMGVANAEVDSNGHVSLHHQHQHQHPGHGHGAHDDTQSEDEDEGVRCRRCGGESFRGKRKRGVYVLVCESCGLEAV